jgi:hypothetical protein
MTSAVDAPAARRLLPQPREAAMPAVVGGNTAGDGREPQRSCLGAVIGIERPDGASASATPSSLSVDLSVDVDAASFERNRPAACASE